MKIKFYKGAGILFAFKGQDWEVLLFRRAIRPYKGFWSIVGGKCEPNEDFRTAAQREASEEVFWGDHLNHRLKEYLPPNFDFSTIPEEIYSNWFFFKWRNYLVQFKKKPPMELIKLNFENDSARWFPVNKPPKNLFPGLVRTFKAFNLH